MLENRSEEIVQVVEAAATDMDSSRGLPRRRAQKYDLWTHRTSRQQECVLHMLRSRPMKALESGYNRTR